MIIYSTPDVNLASYLKTLPPAKFAGTYMVGKKVFFKFEAELSQEDLQKALLDYSNGDVLVEPNDFCNNQSALRGWLHNSRDSAK